MEVRFLSSNPHKIQEAEAIMRPAGIQVIPASVKIEELQTENVLDLVRDKTLKAFKAIGRPLFVEHTGLELSGLNGLPGGLTQIFWDRLQADAFVKLVDGLSSRRVIAKTVIGYCDSREIHFFDGQVEGKVSSSPRGDRSFQWDCIFLPNGEEKTFAELGELKNDISMRRLALDKLAAFLVEK